MAPRKKSAKAAKPSSKDVAAAEKFVDDLVTRGEAVKKKPGTEELPPGATHWLSEEGKTGARSVKRGRFSLR